MKKCTSCEGVNKMPARVSNPNVLTPESTQKLEETLSLEPGKFKFNLVPRYNSTERAWFINLAIKTKGSSAIETVTLGSI